MGACILTVGIVNSSGTVTPPSFVSWLTKEQCSFRDGTPVACWLLDWNCDDDALDEWALHIRRHYIRDKELADRCANRGEKPTTYLPRRIVPDKSQIRSGDFAEILISDVLEYLCKYAVPRYKQNGRKDKNSSEHGSDVIAYRIQDDVRASSDDMLLAFEVKSNVSGKTEKSFRRRVEDAATDSTKDPNRVPMTLDYMIDEANKAGDVQIGKALLRFFNKGGATFREVYGSAVITQYDTPNNALSSKLPSEVQLDGDSPLIVVHAQKLMGLINSLYDRMDR